MKRLVVALVTFSFVFIATGCGQSGPLYIPGNPSRIQTPPPQQEQAEGEEEEEKEAASDKE